MTAEQAVRAQTLAHELERTTSWGYAAWLYTVERAVALGLADDLVIDVAAAGLGPPGLAAVCDIAAVARGVDTRQPPNGRQARTSPASEDAT